MLKPNYPVKYSNPLEELIGDLEDRFSDRCEFYGSEMKETLSINDNDWDEAIMKAEKACSTLNIPLRYNFKVIYKATGQGILKDIKLSKLAAYFVAVNSDPENPLVAQLHLIIAKKFHLL